MLDARIAFQREIAPGTLTFPRDRQMEPRHVNPRFRWDRVTGNHQRSFHERCDSKVSRLLDGDDPILELLSKQVDETRLLVG